MRALASLSLLSLLVPTAGCCSLARLFCGPDDSEWVSVAFDTPKKATKTLLEALRRADSDRIYLSLSDRFRKRLDVDALTTHLVLEKLREQNPGLHLAGYAEVPEPTMRGSDEAEVAIDVEGTRLELRLRRQASWQVRFRRANGTTSETGQPMRSLTGFADITTLDGDEDKSSIDLAPLVFYHDGLDEVPPQAIEYVGVRREWKIDNLRLR